MESMSSGTKHLYEFGPFRLDSQKRVLLRDGAAVALTPKALETLSVLVANRDRVLSKDDLMKKLWPDSFVEESNLSQNIFMLRKALGDSAQEKRYILTIPGRGYQFTETVREIGGVEEEATLVLESHSTSRVVVDQRASGWTDRIAVPAGVPLLLILIALVAGGTWAYRSRQWESAGKKQGGFQSALKLRRSVAVLGFRNLSRRPDEAWLSTALAEMLNTELAAGEQLRMIPGEDVARASRDMAWGDTDTLGKNSLSRLRSNLGTDYVTLGSYTVLMEGEKKLIRLDFRLQDAAAGETLAEDAVTGSEADLFDLVSEVGSRMRERLAIGKVSSDQAAQVRSSMPSNPKAARLYAEGLGKFWKFDTIAARDLLTQAVAADPESPQTHAALSNAWLELGYKTKAKDEMKRAFELSTNLNREERLWIEAQYHDLNEQTRGEPQKAIELFRALADLYPDNLAYGLRLASLQDSLGQPKEAMATLESLRRLPSPLGDDPRIDLAEATGAEAVGDYKREQQLSAVGAEKGKARGARLVIARARLYESSALEQLGEMDRASAALAEAKVLFAAAGDLRHSAETLIWSGNALNEKGDFEGARRQAEEALVIFRQIGYQGYVGQALNGIGEALSSEGRLAEAKPYFEQALKIYREIEYKVVTGDELANIGNVLEGLGDLAGAKKSLEEALQVFTEVGDKHAAGVTECNLGSVLVDQGDLAGATDHYQRALQLSQETGSKAGQGEALLGQADLLLRQDALQAGQAKAEEALKIYRELSEGDRIGESLTAIALVQLERGQLAEAEHSISEATHQLEGSKSPQSLARAYSVLALTLTAKDHGTEAQAAALKAVALAGKASNRPPKFEAALAAGDANAVVGRLTESHKLQAEVLAEASKLGYEPYVLQARLALGRQSLKSGDGASGRTQLASLEKEARGKGFLLIARKAAALGSNAPQMAQAQE
jgi:DNA-binding winged helix-turn-helix (wHTH) protein/tetratricopeptide (TPR) repeat protein